MAKRFTDTEKWKKEWFRKLPVKMKVAWEYLRDNCDNAGIWEGDFALMSFQIGADITLEDCLSYFGESRFYQLESGKFFLPTFVSFQYGELNHTNRAHVSVIQKLRKEGASKPLASPMDAPSIPLRQVAQGAKDKDKDKDKEKDKEMDMDKEKEKDKETYAAQKHLEELRKQLNSGVTGGFSRFGA